MSHKALVIDTESTLNAKDKAFLADPHHADNKIVYLGKSELNNPSSFQSLELYKHPMNSELALQDILSSNLLIGHNIKFDLILLNREFINTILTDAKASLIHTMHEKGIEVWDTQLAEYILTGQLSKQVSLDDLIIKYLGKEKIKDLSLKQDYWNEGISTEDIPKSVVLPYLHNDVETTRQIAIMQMRQAKKEGMLKFIQMQMLTLLATTEAEINGMYICQHEIKKQMTNKSASLKETESLILNIIRDNLITTKELQDDLKNNPELFEEAINIKSNLQKPKFFYGGKIKYTSQEQIGVYKTGEKAGQPKYKKVTKHFELKSVIDSKYRVKKTVTGNPQIDTAWLAKLSAESDSEKASELAKLMLKFSLDHKIMNTYLKPLSSTTHDKETRGVVYKHDMCVHHKLHQTTTVTGRLSSTEPNLQNIPRNSKSSEIKKAFESRFFQGKIVEADYSQLEVVALAFLSQDKQLISDIKNGVDMHLQNASVLFGVPPEKVTKEMRTKAKIGTFQLQYGAGANTIAEVFGGDVKLAKKLIDTYYNRYPKIKKMFENNLKSLQQSATDELGLRFDNGLKQRTATLKSITGRKYVLKQYLNTWSVAEFSPTEIKNYPVQGLATADIVPLMLGMISRNLTSKLKYQGRALLINTVHDSILFDVTEDDFEEFIVDLKNEMQKIYEYLEDIYGIYFNLPLGVVIKAGNSWGDMKTIVETKR